ncbi:indolepyruvate ferredoxin oxidoreductase family protein [Salinarimonas ramus]|uniref:Indolepyruvate ferredoxin oxidoreductase n=1 Tax=Salinarimonas ramus TaxID=690164 RepID=A0A917QC81_9HYPH|nr:indolepyruvate ferredoxin oxidoreductase family protein [Salinarimonas ramus]GGK44050.1 indolepyruvate ferredoxin oxidoreductase [Salinarimonas ramus]
MTTPEDLNEARYGGTHGRVYLTGVQALARLPIDQARRDRAAGLTTAGYVSGYRGSPLGTFDKHLAEAHAHLAAHDVLAQPGLNEDLAATAVWGTQLAALNQTRRVDGVFGLWYGKGPGVDRSGDALKHANMAGTSALGGVVAVAGDDHGASSSTVAHQSDHAFIAAQIPILAPGSVREILEYGLLGFSMSRFTGLWVGMKATTEVVEGASAFEIAPERPAIHLPEGFEAPPGGLHVRWPDNPPAAERRLAARMEALRAFADANRGLDRVLIESPRPRLGIVASGKAAHDVRAALALLGLDETEAAARGLSLLKPGLIWPLAAGRMRNFSRGLETLLVVEEKRPVVEDQLARILIGTDAPPRLLGKTDEAGRPLVPSVGLLDPAHLAAILAERLLAIDPSDTAVAQARDALRAREASRPAPAPPGRAPYFCAGCPHNVSTRVPEGSNAMAGIGCHGMATWVPDRAIVSMTHMGGEGMHWVGQAPFVTEAHRFQNMGDGTYAHSGSLNVRAAVAAGVTLTFKILFNDAVAMTGGQRVEGALTVDAIARQALADGVSAVAVVADDPSRHRGRLPAGVTLDHRDALDGVQRRLREMSGVTVLIYDQVCATEKRRRRKRGTAPAAERRVIINERVCEGCGDCSAKSGCIAITPVETDFGRKRRIDQSSCNVDTSCLKGFCPSFVTLEGARPRRRAGAPEALARLADIPLPEPDLADGTRAHTLVLPGIGGTGIVTTAQVLANAADRAGLCVSALDMAGLAQKNGAVVSYLRIGGSDVDAPAKPAPGCADLVLAADLVVAAAPAIRDLVGRGRTRVRANADVAPSLAFVFDGALDLSGRSERAALRDAAGAEALATIPAERLARAAFGDTIAANMILAGFAWQQGLVPIPLPAIDAAIAANGVAIEANRAAFALGRRYAVAPEAVAGAFEAQVSLEETAPAESAGALIERYARELETYQSGRYAQRYRRALADLSTAEARVAPESDALVATAARALYKLMAYKDEYEVARLQVDPAFVRRIAEEFDGVTRIVHHLAPPGLTGRDPVTGEPRKRAFGPWIRPVLHGLAAARRLRGTPLDPFGWNAERREERALVRDYEELLSTLSMRLTPDNHDRACALAGLALEIRGYGPVKARAVARYREALASGLRSLDAPAAPTRAPLTEAAR